MNTPFILTGPPSCGKSHWIQQYAKQHDKQLFVCPCRKDRTLREGRQKLHIWARRIEPAILWLEGADDLTPEAQAFLRRILETHASDVLFILECRDAGRLQEPIRSRCIIKRMSIPTWSELAKIIPEHFNHEEIRNYLHASEYSYRRIEQCIYLQQYYPDTWKHIIQHRQEENQIKVNMNSDHLMEYRMKGYHPDHLIHSLLSNECVLKDYGKCIELGGSLWAFLGCALDTVHTTTSKQEE
jgi:hypothetical protein